MSFKQEHDKAERDWIKYLRTLDTKDLAKELYKKHKRTVDEVCEYLRHRSWIDGIQQYSKKKPSYKWWVLNISLLVVVNTQSTITMV